MRANEFVTELFEPGKPWQWSFQGSEEAVAVFQVGEVSYMFHAYGSDGEWEAEFKQHGSKLSRTQKFGLTGTGNSAEVMSTVVDIMRAFLEKYRDKIQVLSFSAKEDSRQGLYARMVKRLLPDWTMKQSGEHFVLVAPKQAVAESLQPNAAGCIIVAEDTGRWCLQQRSDTVSDPGVWSTWGGSREPGETLEQTVRRELAEEGGYVGPLKLEPLSRNSQYATFIGRVPHEFEPRINKESKDWCWCEADQLPSPLHPGLAKSLSNFNLNESTGKYKEIEFICVNPQFPEATDPELQKQMFVKLKQIPGVIPLWQEWGDYSEGQLSLSAIYKDRTARSKILSLAKQLSVEVDLEQPVSDDYVDRAIRGEHEGQIAENFADGKVKGKSRPGRVKRAGASCKGSVSDLRARAKKYGGERGRMYHWCANMKSGRKK